MGRAPCCDKATVKKGPWSPEEDAMLKNYIEEHGTGGNWIALPHKIGLKRCGKSCRLRWLNYLRPNIKHGDFTPEEDSIICSLYISIGSRWSIIAAQLPGRTDNDVKNYWNTKLKKRLLGRRKDRGGGGGGHHHRSQSTADDLPAGGDGGERSLSASAMERIQLCMHLQELQNPLAIHHNPLLSQWPSKATTGQNHNNHSFNSNHSNSSSMNNVTVAEHGMSSSVSDNHRLNGQQLESAAAMASPSSGGENSNVVVAIEAELQELLYGGDGSQGRGGGGGAIIDGGDGAPHGDVDWWSYDQGKQSPVTCWDFTPETSSIFQDYTTVYDI